MSNGIDIQPRVQPFAPGIDALRGLASSVVSDVMGRMEGSTGLHPVNRSPVQACGNAVTVKVRAGDNLLIHRALDMLEPGDVLVVDGQGDLTRALVGEIMMHTARVRGAVAFVMDGAVRDVDAFETHGFPCWARGVNLRGPMKDGPGTLNHPVTVGCLLVHPGDIVLGDGDGVVAVRPAAALEVAKLAREKEAHERATIAAIQAGTYSSAWVYEALKQKGA